MAGEWRRELEAKRRSIESIGLDGWFGMRGGKTEDEDEDEFEDDCDFGRRPRKEVQGMSADFVDLATINHSFSF